MVALGNSTVNGQTLFAKNSDRPVDECQPLALQPRHTYPDGARVHCQFVDLPQVAVTYRHVGSRPYWCWGYEHGFNEHGVVIGNEALSSRLPEANEARLIGMELLRLGLERARTAGEAVAVITSLVERYGQGKFANQAGVRTYDNGFIVADPTSAYILETAGHQWAVKEVERAVGISNVYSVGADWDRLSSGAEADAAARGWQGNEPGRLNFAATYAAAAETSASGATRRARSCAMLAGSTGAIDARRMMQILRDHGPGRTFETLLEAEQPSLCMHTGGAGTWGNTAASLVADLCADGSRLAVYWCSFYAPCLGLFLPIFVEGDLPALLSRGGGTPDDQSPWWRFHQLTRWALAEAGTRGPRVQEAWAPLQAHLLETAYPVAAEGRHLLDTGRADEAEALLSAYMARNVATMLDTLRAMPKVPELI
jgi:dipeptidase